MAAIARETEKGSRLMNFARLAFVGVAFIVLAAFGDLLLRIAHGMTFWGWIVLAAIGLYFFYELVERLLRWFFAGLFGGLGVRASGVVGELSRRPKPPPPAYKIIRQGAHWRVRAPNGALLGWRFGSRENAMRLISEIEKGEKE